MEPRRIVHLLKPVFLQDRRSNDGAHPASAKGNHRAILGHVSELIGEFAQKNVSRTGQSSPFHLAALANVQQGEVLFRFNPFHEILGVNCRNGLIPSAAGLPGMQPLIEKSGNAVIAQTEEVPDCFFPTRRNREGP
jgi:hypothetical protein